MSVLFFLNCVFVLLLSNCSDNDGLEYEFKKESEKLINNISEKEKSLSILKEKLEQIKIDLKGSESRYTQEGKKLEEIKKKLDKLSAEIEEKKKIEDQEKKDQNELNKEINDIKQQEQTREQQNQQVVKDIKYLNQIISKLNIAINELKKNIQ